jgi:hypothetical protein
MPVPSPEPERRLQTRPYITYAGACAAVLALTIVARAVDPALFERFIGGVSPVMVVAVVSLLGAALLRLLDSRGGFAIIRPQPARGLLRAAGLAALFGMLVMGVDLVLTHPADMNVPFPESLVFYPVISLMAEILFHLLPLAALLTATSAFARHGLPERAVWASLFLVSLLEPSFQVLAAMSERPVVGAPHPYDARVAAFDGLHVWAINIGQLAVFRRYDFVSMWTFRLVYYVIWHVVWGELRLRMLF